MEESYLESLIIVTFTFLYVFILDFFLSSFSQNSILTNVWSGREVIYILIMKGKKGSIKVIITHLFYIAEY